MNLAMCVRPGTTHFRAFGIRRERGGFNPAKHSLDSPRPSGPEELFWEGCERTNLSLPPFRWLADLLTRWPFPNWNPLVTNVSNLPRTLAVQYPSSA
jgi:hypothetical protein